jgi:hypothetical protein
LGTAQVEVIEGHDAVFQVSKPVVSSLRNVYHTFELEQENGEWKITSDYYEDYLWRWLRTTGQSISNLEQTMGVDMSDEPAILSNEIETKTIKYNRLGATDYAHQWALAPRPYNPKYIDFTDLGGDCTNFVSQAIFEGGEVGMVFGGVHDIGTVGWYFYDVNDRAIAWTWVDGLYNFIVKEQYIWEHKLLGREVGHQNAIAGDIIQYNWGTDAVWDHSVLIVSPNEMAIGDEVHLVAGHSPDVDNYPYTTMVYSPSYRFIHIESDEKRTQEVEEEIIGLTEQVEFDCVCPRKLLSIPCPSNSLLVKRLCRMRVDCKSQ